MIFNSMMSSQGVRIPMLAAILASICIFPGLGNDAPDFKVWVVNDSVWINPLANRAYEDNPYLFPDGWLLAYAPRARRFSAGVPRGTSHPAATT